MQRSLTTEEFIEKANRVHNSLYDYSKVSYEHSQKKVCIIDPNYGEFWQIPNSHLNGNGNPTRAKHARSAIRHLTTKEFIRRANRTHDKFYDYSRANYINSRTKICIIDSEYGEFWQRPADHLMGHGCPQRTSYNGKDSIHKDHIIPITILGKRNILNKERPLYKFLSSEINIQLIAGNDNINKSDLLEINGNVFRARHVRNNYKIIEHLAKSLLNLDIADIIKEDRKFLDKNM